MLESTLTIKGQTTLPKPVREALGIAPGDKLRYLIVGDEVRILRPVKLASLAGMLAGDRVPGSGALSLDEMDDAIADSASQRAARVTGKSRE